MALVAFSGVKRPTVERMSGRLLDRLADLGADGSPVDLMGEFAFRLPVAVISEGEITILELMESYAKGSWQRDLPTIKGMADEGRMRIEFDSSDNGWMNDVGWQYHHCGGTRMHSEPRKGVVDANCRVHGLANLYVAGSSIFPTSGHANPTINLLAFTLRLADHLKREVADCPRQQPLCNGDPCSCCSQPASPAWRLAYRPLGAQQRLCRCCAHSIKLSPPIRIWQNWADATRCAVR